MLTLENISQIIPKLTFTEVKTGFTQVHEGFNDDLHMNENIEGRYSGFTRPTRNQDLDIPMITPTTTTTHVTVRRELMDSVDDEADIRRLRCFFDDTIRCMMIRNANRPESTRRVIGKALGEFQQRYDEAEGILLYPTVCKPRWENESADDCSGFLPSSVVRDWWYVQ